MDTLTSKTISALRLPLAVMVVFIHSFGLPAENYNVNWELLTGFDIYNIIRIACSHVISQIAVPTFFLFSGYLFFVKASSFDWSFYKKQWKKRVYTLLIPYVLWNIIPIIWSSLLRIAAIFIKGRPISWLFEYWESILTWRIFWDFNTWGGGRHNLLGQITTESTGPLSIPLWFLRDLIIVVLFAPLICWLIRKTKGGIILLLGIIWLLKINVIISPMLITTSFFFSIGCYFALYKREFACFFQKYNAITLPLWLLLIIASIYFDGANTDTGLLCYTPMVLCGVCAAIGTTAYIISKRGNKPNKEHKIYDFAARNTFFIYVSHGIFGLTISGILLGKIFQLLPENAFFLTAHYLLNPFVAIGICLLILLFLKRFMPKTTKVLIGER